MCHVTVMTKLTLKADKKTLRILKSQLEKAELDTLCIYEESAGDIVLGAHAYPKVVRLGKLLDDITRTSKQQNEQTLIMFGGNTLDPAHAKFKNTEGHIITLTEKEVEILAHLHKNKPNAISKETLLNVVWNYAGGVETHTLETHIYRLRQKIEPDPANPQILITTESGYTVID